VFCSCFFRSFASQAIVDTDRRNQISVTGERDNLVTIAMTKEEHIVRHDILNDGLRASSFVYDFSRKRIRENSSSSVVSQEDYKKLKRAAMQMNFAITKLARLSKKSEDRLALEIHILKEASRADYIDREANRARVFELLRRYKASAMDQHNNLANGDTIVAASGSGISSNIVDRAIWSANRIENAILGLSAKGKTTVHGAPLLQKYNVVPTTVSAPVPVTRAPQTKAARQTTVCCSRM
jgi:hypothetical protein